MIQVRASSLLAAGGAAWASDHDISWALTDAGPLGAVVAGLTTLAA